ncbi:coiled-coil domain-containing protein 188 [Petaurus breviceps papuanus]|uniref:coiled-coil domain-containing protein 188 n=1 Tax=Petaurus breviceps papuanus TaxID=3040969 RepID=UPI0036DE1419
MDEPDSWTNPHGEFRQRFQGYPVPPPPPHSTPMQPHTVLSQPRFLRCSVVNLSPCKERNTILELEQANQRQKDMNQDLRGQLEDIMEPREMRQDFICMCPNHQCQLQIQAWEKKCPQMMDDPRTVQVLKQKIHPHEDPFAEKSQKELQKMRLSFERKKTSITEVTYQPPQVWDSMSEVHMSLNDQAEGFLLQSRGCSALLATLPTHNSEISAILDLHRDKAQSQTLTRKGLPMEEKKVSILSTPPCPHQFIQWKPGKPVGSGKRAEQVCPVINSLHDIGGPPPPPPSPGREDNQSLSWKPWTIVTKAGLCLLVCSVLFYLYVVNPSPCGSLLPSIIGQKTICCIRTWCNPFLRVEEDDFLPF